MSLFFNPRIANIKQVAGIYGSAVYEEMKKEWESRSWGDIFSVLGARSMSFASSDSPPKVRNWPNLSTSRHRSSLNYTKREPMVPFGARGSLS